MPKQMSGDDRQRRAKAREARERGESASAAGVTRGASKQRKHLAREEDHVEKITTPRKGKPEQLTANVDDRPNVKPGTFGDDDELRRAYKRSGANR